jgi:hypothetical protein
VLALYEQAGSKVAGTAVQAIATSMSAADAVASRLRYRSLALSSDARDRRSAATKRAATTVRARVVTMTLRNGIAP